MPEAAASGFQCLWSGLHRQAVPGQYPAQPVPPAPQPGITLILQKIMQLAGPHPWLFAIVPVVRSVLRASKWSACRLAIARGLAKSLFYGRGAVIVLPHIDYGLRRTGPEELANQRPWGCLSSLMCCSGGWWLSGMEVLLSARRDTPCSNFADVTIPARLSCYYICKPYSGRDTQR